MTERLKEASSDSSMNEGETIELRDGMAKTCLQKGNGTHPEEGMLVSRRTRFSFFAETCCRCRRCARAHLASARAG